MTIQEYLIQYNLTEQELAKKLGISKNSLSKAMNKIAISYDTARKFKKHNIQVIYRSSSGTISNTLSVPKNQSNSLIKTYHIKALKQFKNTIILKITDPKTLQQEFKKLGLNVNIKESLFTNNTLDKPHYIIEIKD